MDENKEKKLIRRAQRGDKKAIADLYDSHYRAVYNYIYYRVSDSQTAEDISAEVFIRMLNKLPAYVDRGRPFLAWLYAIARNMVIDHYRLEEKKAEVQIMDEVLEDQGLRPDQQVQNNQTGGVFQESFKIAAGNTEAIIGVPLY